MITKTRAFQTSDNTVCQSLEEAQTHEIGLLYGDFEPGELPEKVAIARFMLENKDKIVDILTTKDGSKPKARTINGGTKTRKPRTPKQPTAPALPGTEPTGK